MADSKKIGDALGALEEDCPDKQQGNPHSPHHWRPDLDRKDFEVVEENDNLRICYGM